MNRDRQSDKPNDPRPFGLHLHRVDAVTPDAIDNVCHELFVLAMEHNGEYDGWEASA